MEDNFEKQWREAFEDASQEPPKIVWSQVSQQLTDQRLIRMQRNQAFYQIASAAAILLAAFFGYQYFTKSGNIETNQLAENATSKQNQIFSLPIYQPLFEEVIATSELVEQLPVLTNLLAAQKEEEGKGEWLDLIDFELLETNLKIESNALAVNFGEVKDHLYGVPATYLVKKKSKEHETFWAGLNVAGGSFDPNYEGGTTSLSESLSLKSNQFSSSNLANDVNSRSPTVQEGMSSGQSRGFGFNFGLSLSDRWSLQSGLQYSRASATSTTNAVIETRQSVNPIPASSQFARVSQVQDILNAEEVVNYEYKDVDLSNKFQFASIPLKAGYKIIDQKFSMGLNAGLLANLYLGNKLTDPSSQVAEVTIGPGSDSPYKQINFMGLAGIQLGYEVLHRFDLTLEPNYRHSLNSSTKSGAEFATNPSGLGLQTGIRYRFQ